jgi:putative transposase
MNKHAESAHCCRGGVCTGEVCTGGVCRGRFQTCPYHGEFCTGGFETRPDDTTGINPRNPKAPRRKSIRLKHYDYSQAGAYFVTVCTHERQCLFGEIQNGNMRLNQFGQIVADCWLNLPHHYSHIELHDYVVMPNHFHGIVVIVDTVGAGFVRAGFKPARTESLEFARKEPAMVGVGLKPAPTNPTPTGRHGLPEIVRALKTFSARRINEYRNTPGISVWQRNYYEHIIRNEAAYLKIANYIQTNPQRWLEDTYYV